METPTIKGKHSRSLWGPAFGFGAQRPLEQVVIEDKICQKWWEMFTAFKVSGWYIPFFKYRLKLMYHISSQVISNYEGSLETSGRTLKVTLIGWNASGDRMNRWNSLSLLFDVRKIIALADWTYLSWCFNINSNQNILVKLDQIGSFPPSTGNQASLKLPRHLTMATRNDWCSTCRTNTKHDQVCGRGNSAQINESPKSTNQKPSQLEHNTFLW